MIRGITTRVVLSLRLLRGSEFVLEGFKTIYKQYKKYSKDIKEGERIRFKSSAAIFCSTKTVTDLLQPEHNDKFALARTPQQIFCRTKIATVSKQRKLSNSLA
jgi:hypothetical protein